MGIWYHDKPIVIDPWGISMDCGMAECRMTGYVSPTAMERLAVVVITSRDALRAHLSRLVDNHPTFLQTTEGLRVRLLR